MLITWLLVDTAEYGNSELWVMKLLIVDDHADAREVIRSYLTPLADEIHECDSGAAVISHCMQQPPDVITLDLRLGQEDGVPVLEFVRAHFPQIHVVVVTQFGDAHISALVLRLGAVACFAKADLVGLRAYLLHRKGAQHG
ncbi:MAG: response regulator [Steroidobacteraceae bacterium]